jgi:hypothetical protein
MRRGNLGENRFRGDAIESLVNRNKLIPKARRLDFRQEEFFGFLQRSFLKIAFASHHSPGDPIFQQWQAILLGKWSLGRDTCEWWQTAAVKRPKIK